MANGSFNDVLLVLQKDVRSQSANKDAILNSLKIVHVADREYMTELPTHMKAPKSSIGAIIRELGSDPRYAKKIQDLYNEIYPGQPPAAHEASNALHNATRTEPGPSLAPRGRYDEVLSWGFIFKLSLVIMPMMATVLWWMNFPSCPPCPCRPSYNGFPEIN